MSRPNIAVAGFTAAGKTTHAKLLAEALGYRYIGATEILLELIGIESPVDRAWFEHSDRIAAARNEYDVDAELDRRLVQLAKVEDGLVIDSWAIAWTGPTHMIKLWIESDTESRTWKCYVSQGNDPQHDLHGCGQLIADKDSSTRLLFLDRHGFDLFGNREVFDAILDNTHLIRQPTRHAADAGIEAFEPVVTAVVNGLLAGEPRLLASAFGGWTADQRRCVKHVNRAWSEGVQ